MMPSPREPVPATPKGQRVRRSATPSTSSSPPSSTSARFRPMAHSSPKPELEVVKLEVFKPNIPMICFQDWLLLKEEGKRSSSARNNNGSPDLFNYSEKPKSGGERSEEKKRPRSFECGNEQREEMKRHRLSQNFECESTFYDDPHYSSPNEEENVENGEEEIWISSSDDDGNGGKDEEDNIGHHRDAGKNGGPEKEDDEDKIGLDGQDNSMSIGSEVPKEDGAQGPPVSCEHCPKSFWTVEEKEKHYRGLSGKKNFECPRCGKMYMTRGKLTEHLMGVHENRIRCEKCDKCFQTRAGLKLHSQDCQVDGKRICSICQARFHTIGMLQKHLDHFHGEQKTNF